MDDLLRLEETCRQARLTLAAQQNAGMLTDDIIICTSFSSHHIITLRLKKRINLQ